MKLNLAGELIKALAEKKNENIFVPACRDAAKRFKNMIRSTEST